MDWTQIIVTALGSLTTIALAYISLQARKISLQAKQIHNEMKTPSGKPLGEVAEFTHDTAIANNMHLNTMHEDMDSQKKPPL